MIFGAFARTRAPARRRSHSLLDAVDRAARRRRSVVREATLRTREGPVDCTLGLAPVLDGEDVTGVAAEFRTPAATSPDDTAAEPPGTPCDE